MLLPATLNAQTGKVLLTEGIAAHRDLEFVAAARLLARALSSDMKPPLTGLDRDRALAYLGSAYVNQNEREEAATAFRTLVIENPRFRPDSLVFPPPVTQLFAEVIQTTKAVAVEVADQQTLTAGGKDFPIRIYASSAHQVTVTILGPAGDTVAALFDGPIQDTLTVAWNGLAAEEKPVASGSYRLEVASKLSSTTVMRALRIPLEIQTTAVTAAPPRPRPPDSLLLPERQPAGPALAILVPGVVLGTAVMTSRGLGGARFVFGGAIATAGVVGFFLKRPGRPIHPNIAANARLRRDWIRRADASREQARQRGSHRLVIRAGAPDRVELGAKP